MLPACDPNMGYAASWWLLLAHLKYLQHRDAQPDAAVATAQWLLTDSTAEFTRAMQNNTGWHLGSWYRDNSAQWWLRVAIARTSEIAMAIGLLLLSAIILPLLLQTAGALIDVTWRNIANLIDQRELAQSIIPSALVAQVWHAIFGHAGSYWGRVWRLGVAAIALPLAVGVAHGMWTRLRPTYANPPIADPPSTPAIAPLVALAFPQGQPMNRQSSQQTTASHANHERRPTIMIRALPWTKPTPTPHSPPRQQPDNRQPRLHGNHDYPTHCAIPLS